MIYRVKLTPTAAKMFTRLHPDIKTQLKSKLKSLQGSPHLGKKLQNELANLRSLKMKRYRIIYQIAAAPKAVIVYAIGQRRDIYEIIAELIP